MFLSRNFANSADKLETAALLMSLSGAPEPSGGASTALETVMAHLCAYAPLHTIRAMFVVTPLSQLAVCGHHLIFIVLATTQHSSLPPRPTPFPTTWQRPRRPLQTTRHRHPDQNGRQRLKETSSKPSRARGADRAAAATRPGLALSTARPSTPQLPASLPSTRSRQRRTRCSPF